MALVRTWAQMREIEDNSPVAAIAVVALAGVAEGVDRGLSLTLKLDRAVTIAC